MAETRSGIGSRRPILPALLAASLLFLTLVGTAHAADERGITAFSVTPSSTQAGGHPDVAVHFAWFNEFGVGTEARVVTTHFPEGFIGNPHVPPACTAAEFSLEACPVDSQIGIVEVFRGEIFSPLYNMETKPDQAGLTATIIPFAAVGVYFELSARTDGDYGLDSTSVPLLHVGLDDTTFHLWGVPADPKHDYQRFSSPLEGVGGCYTPETGCQPGTAFQSPTFAEPSVPPAPFLQSPTTCDVPLTASGDLEYYGGFTVHAEAAYPAATGCQQLGFSPTLSVSATTTQADAASGLDIDLQVPQAQSPYAPTASELRTSRITLPVGFSLNPNAADGKVACSDADTAIGTLGSATCPEFAKVGTVEVLSTALPGPIFGALYLGQPKSGERYRVILAADGFATHVKLVGTLDVDPQTGQLTTVFDQPQTPLQEVKLHIFGSERGLLATPTQCGTYAVQSEFIPWDSALPTYQSTSPLTIDSGPGGAPCPDHPRPFHPSFQAGTRNNTAGSYAPFALAVGREDGEQDLTDLRVATPPGFSASLAGLSYCSEPAIARLSDSAYPGLTELASPSCPPSSQVGTAVAAVGAGSRPLYVPGHVYLAGPYRGAPLSLLFVIPAVSGPYDLGNVALRARVHVDPLTAQVTAFSDPLPRIFGGIPLRTRLVQVDLDRPGFTLNPTNCDPHSVDAVVSGDEGAIETPSAPFQIANCAELPYGPRLSLTLSGGVRRRGHPAIHAVLSAAPGEANTRSVSVTLPTGLLLDNSHISSVCTRADFARGTCPSGSRIGHAEVRSPLLDNPLAGAVYLRSSQHGLPDLALDLEGQFKIEAIGRVDSVRGRYRATFESVPDVPVSRLQLDLAGGHRGLLQNSESLCGSRRRAVMTMTGQNGARLQRHVALRTACRAVPGGKRGRGDQRRQPVQPGKETR